MKKRVKKKVNLRFKSVFNSIRLSDSKRSQAAVFILFAVVIAIAIGIAFFISKNASQQNISREFFETEEIKPKIDNIKNSVSDCMKTTASDALDLIGIQGGYYQKPKEYFDLGWAFIPYYYKQGLFLMPAKQEIEKQLSMYVDENIRNCIDNINKGDFQIVYSKPKTKTLIEKGNVKFTIDMLVSISKEGNAISLNLKESPVEQNSKLYEIIEIAEYLTDSHKKDSDSFCVNCVADMARERDLYVDMISFSEDSTLNIVSENSTSETPYVFEFLNEYVEESF